MLLEVSLILHANPLATIAARRFALVTTAGSGPASNSVAHVGTTTAIYKNAFVAVAVPPGVVTATLAAPTVPAGVTAVMVVDESTTTLVAATPPIVTLVAPVKVAPVIVNGVPPTVEPVTGETEEIIGSAKYINAFDAVAVPFGVVTATLAAPTVPAGVTAVMLVDESTTTLVAATPPIVTLVAPVKLAPVIVIAVPPAVAPEFGVTDEM